MKKVSVVVLVYNVSMYLKKCLNSLVNQTYKDYEIVIVNDGSTDSSLEILEEYKEEYPGLFKIYSIKNGGRSNARNYGISKVETEFFTFVDGDDYIDSRMLEKLVGNLDKDTDISICDSMRIFDDGNESILRFFRLDIEDKNKAMMVSYPGPCGKLYRTSLFRDNKIIFPKNVNCYEDMAVIPTLGLYTDKIKYIGEPLYKYVIHNDSAIRPKFFSEKRAQDLFRVMDFLNRKFHNRFNEELEFIYIEHLLRTASLRFSSFKEGRECVIKINDLMHQKYPNYIKNRYYKKVSFRFKILCYLAYHRIYWVLRILARMNVR